jgi:opacity protein-like surface antigen
MRKSALLLAAVMIAAAPTAALAAKKAKAPADPNAAGQKLVYNALMQPYYAWQSIWVVTPAKKK